jgi:hypothetical protein
MALDVDDTDATYEKLRERRDVDIPRRAGHGEGFFQS